MRPFYEQRKRSQEGCLKPHIMRNSMTPEEATTALTLFLEGNYDACLQILQRLDLNDIVLEADGIEVDDSQKTFLMS